MLTTLRDGLRAGDVWVDGTRNYRRFDASLLPKQETGAAIADLPVDTDVSRYLERRAEELDQRLTRFARLLGTGRLDGVSLVRGKLRVAPLSAVTPPEPSTLDRTLDGLLPRVRITELLREVAVRIGFVTCFRDLRAGKEHDNPNAVLAAILADATNLGLERMANASQGVSYVQLAWTHNWYLSEKNHRAALGCIVDAHRAQPFVRHWGDGSASSSDGKFFRPVLPGSSSGKAGCAVAPAR